jgi:hypothetical protein
MAGLQDALDLLEETAGSLRNGRVEPTAPCGPSAIVPARSGRTTVEPTSTRELLSAGSQSRRRACAPRGNTRLPTICEPLRASVYDTGPKLVGAWLTSIVFPVASQPRGVENARSRPPLRSCTSSSRNVPRNEAFAPVFGGMNIARSYAPRTGSTETASPEMYVPSIMPTARMP